MTNISNSICNITIYLLLLLFFWGGGGGGGGRGGGGFSVNKMASSHIVHRKDYHLNPMMPAYAPVPPKD